MMKLVLIHGNDNRVMDALETKYNGHILRPALMALMPVFPKEVDVPGLYDMCKQVSEGGPVIFMIKSFGRDDELHEHFCVFNVFDKPEQITAHKDRMGVWLADKSEVDFLFNQIVQWTFD